MLKDTQGIQYSKLFSAILLTTSLGLAGCGGGGDGDNPFSTATDNGNDSGVTPTTSQTLTLNIDTSKQNLEQEDSATITVTLTNEDEEKVNFDPANFSITSGCLGSGDSTLKSPDAGTTSSASYTYTASGCTDQDTLTISGTVAEKSYSSKVSFTIEDSITMNVEIDPETATLDPGDIALIRLTFTNQKGTPVTGSGAFTATSPCLARGISEVVFADPSISSQTLTYQADGCSGEDVLFIEGTWNGTAYNRNVTLNVVPEVVSSISWVSTEPNQIDIKGTGGTETAVITFKLNGQSGASIVGEEVSFRIEGDAGGLTLLNDSAESNTEGLVTVGVKAGTTPANPTIIATHTATGDEARTNEAPSQKLTVATGFAAYGHFNIGLTIFNPKAYNRLNEQSTTVTVSVGDKSGNPVKDGTVVNFVSEEAGLIENKCSTVAGTCSVTWKPDGRGTANDDGRAQVFATVKGTEEFDDNNGNLLFDDGDTFSSKPEYDLGEPYSDNNDNGVYDQGEYFVDSDKRSGETGKRSEADGLWNGLNCMHSTDCSTVNNFVSLGAQVTVIMSSINATICNIGDFNQAITLAPEETISLGGLYLSDGNVNADNTDLSSPACPSGNPLPNGTKVSFEVSGGSIKNEASWTIGNATRPTGAYGVTYKAPSEPATEVLTLKIEVPGENIQEFSWPISVTL